MKLQQFMRASTMTSRTASLPGISATVHTAQRDSDILRLWIYLVILYHLIKLLKTPLFTENYGFCRKFRVKHILFNLFHHPPIVWLAEIVNEKPYRDLNFFAILGIKSAKIGWKFCYFRSSLEPPCNEIIEDIEDLISAQDITPKERYSTRKAVKVKARKKHVSLLVKGLYFIKYCQVVVQNQVACLWVVLHRQTLFARQS